LGACLLPPGADLQAACRNNPASRSSLTSNETPFNVRLCPEISLSLRPQLWGSWQRGLGSESPATPPYWALEWPGGQALARYILDHPEIVTRRIVVDWGAGSGLVAIAAALSGAQQVLAIDRDRVSIDAIRENTWLNRVAQRVLAIQAELPSQSGGEGEVILAADLWYDRFDATRITAALRSVAKRGSTVLIGDTNRAFTPRGGLALLSRYSIPTDPEIEQTTLTGAFVARLDGATETTRV
jgi:predicted nicotinamide N-methyase